MDSFGVLAFNVILGWLVFTSVLRVRDPNMLRTNPRFFFHDRLYGGDRGARLRARGERSVVRVARFEAISAGVFLLAGDAFLIWYHFSS